MHFNYVGGLLEMTKKQRAPLINHSLPVKIVVPFKLESRLQEQLFEQGPALFLSVLP